jgi:hypothetical protein
MPAVVKVVPIVVVDVNVIGLVPILRSVFRPGIHEHERVAVVVEPGITHVDRGAAVHPEPVLTPEIEAEVGLRNVVAAIASTLRPAAMFLIPMLSATLLPRTLPPPGTLLLPSTLLLPRACLLLGTLRLDLLLPLLVLLLLLMLGLLLLLLLVLLLLLTLLLF